MIIHKFYNERWAQELANNVGESPFLKTSPTEPTIWRRIKGRINEARTWLALKIAPWLYSEG